MGKEPEAINPEARMPKERELPKPEDISRVEILDAFGAVTRLDKVEDISFMVGFLCFTTKDSGLILVPTTTPQIKICLKGQPYCGEDENNDE